jgi:hypothetical protein
VAILSLLFPLFAAVISLLTAAVPTAEIAKNQKLMRIFRERRRNSPELSPEKRSGSAPRRP